MVFKGSEQSTVGNNISCEEEFSLIHFLFIEGRDVQQQGPFACHKDILGDTTFLTSALDGDG